MTSAMRAIGHRLMQPGSFLSGGARTDVTSPVATTTRRRKKPAKAEAEDEILEKGRCSGLREQMAQLEQVRPIDI